MVFFWISEPFPRRLAAHGGMRLENLMQGL